MKVCVLFYNLGGYHLARLRAAKEACEEQQIEFTAIEIVGSTAEHPWGEMDRPEYVSTLFAFRDDAHPTVGDPNLLKSKLDLLKPDVIAVPGWGYDFSRLTIGWGQRKNCKMILMSESKKDDAPRKFFKEQIKKHLWVRKFSAALVGGQKHRDYLVDLGMKSDRIFSGYDVVDNDFFADRVNAARIKWQQNGKPNILPTNKYFLTANRFIERKNLPRMVRSFAKAVNSGRLGEPWDLVVLGCGSPNETSRICEEVEESGLQNRIHMPGFVEYSQIGNWYAGASVFIHPALSEQWGLVVNEAMACGLPILLSNACGCYPELVEEGVNGFSFDPEDTDELSKKMVEITKCDLNSMGLASRTRIDDLFSPKQFGKGLVAAINAIESSGTS